jgi:salicylate hydroxylase
VDLHHELLQACRRSPLITLSPGRKVTDFEDAGDRVRLTLDDGTNHEGCALIGADGLWSTIRGRIVGDGKPRVSGHIAYRAVLPIHEVPHELRPNSVVLWAGPKNHLVHYPLRRGELLNIVAVFHSNRYEEGWNTHGDVEELDERFKDNRPEVKTLLGKIDQWRMWVLCDREPIKEWSKGRVTLLGDAAHPMLQYLAQGAGMAIEDAVVLAEKLVAADNDFASAFLAYQEERYLRTARVQLYARLYGDLYHASGVGRELRNLMLREAASKSRKEAMAWLYDGIALNQ